jgi:hypothetical protein
MQSMSQTTLGLAPNSFAATRPVCYERLILPDFLHNKIKDLKKGVL